MLDGLEDEEEDASPREFILCKADETETIASPPLITKWRCPCKTRNSAVKTGAEESLSSAEALPVVVVEEEEVEDRSEE